MILRQVFGLQRQDTAAQPATQPARESKRQPEQQTEASLRIKALRAAGAGRQPRGLNRLRVVPEHKERRIVTLFSKDGLATARAWAAARGRKSTTNLELEGQTFPPSSQLLAADDQTLGGSRRGRRGGDRAAPSTRAGDGSSGHPLHPPRIPRSPQGSRAPFQRGLPLATKNSRLHRVGASAWAGRC